MCNTYTDVGTCSYYSCVQYVSCENDTCEYVLLNNIAACGCM